MVKQIKIQFMISYACFKRGEIVYAIKLNHYYRHVFWLIPDSVVRELLYE